MNDVEKIRHKLGRLTFNKAPSAYLKTGSPELDGVLGGPKGIPFGKIIEIAGMPSTCKSTLLSDLAAIAQSLDAHVIWGDFENSFDPVWNAQRGVKCLQNFVDGNYVGGPDPFTLVAPYLIEKNPTKKASKAKPTSGKAKRAQAAQAGTISLATGEMLLDEIEALMRMYQGKKKMLIAVDSVKAIVPGDVGFTSYTLQGMTQKMELPALLDTVMKRWVGLAPLTESLIILINQLREKPMAFGDPHYTPGGNAIPFYAHVRARTKRAKEARIMKSGKMVGLRGILVNTKNKAGGVEGESIGFKMYNDGRSKFMKIEDL